MLRRKKQGSEGKPPDRKRARSALAQKNDKMPEWGLTRNLIDVPSETLTLVMIVLPSTLTQSSVFLANC
jgi:hypothetical protein